MSKSPSPQPNSSSDPTSSYSDWLPSIVSRLRLFKGLGNATDLFDWALMQSILISWRPSYAYEHKGRILLMQIAHTFSIVNETILPRPSYETPLAFNTPANRTSGIYSKFFPGTSADWKNQSLKRTIRALIPLSQAVPDIAGFSVAPVSALIRVAVWLVNRTAMLFVVASFPSLETKSPMNVSFRLEASWSASLFSLPGTCLLSKPLFGKAAANKVEIESITISPVPFGGNDCDSCVKSAKRWASVGVVKWWKSPRWPSDLLCAKLSGGFSHSGGGERARISLNLGPLSPKEAAARCEHLAVEPPSPTQVTYLPKQHSFPNAGHSQILAYCQATVSRLTRAHDRMEKLNTTTVINDSRDIYNTYAKVVFPTPGGP